MDDINITKGGVNKLLKGLNTSKACGPDNVNPRILKELADEISDVLTNIFQQSLKNGEIPDDWKSANVSPLYKKNDRTEAVNYRPVSLTCICCKILEHIVSSNINYHLEEHDIISPNQHAFRKGYSCETQLSHVINDFSKSLDKKKQVDSFILDFEKAFDTVSHDLLKAKLRGYGINRNTLNWIDAFLSNRTQSVVVNGHKSKTSNVISGVPQGTVLGPLLFSLYINDIAKDIDSTVRLFADDCVCYRNIDSIEDCEKLQSDINKLSSWAKTWKMRFQSTKCNIMQITKKQNIIDYNYKLDDTVLEKVESIKYLGVTITNKLSWNSHIRNVCNKANRTLGLLKRNLSKCTKDVKMQAYKGLVRPILEYSSSIWDPYTAILQDKLEATQKRAARFITNNYEYTPGSMTNILDSLDLPTLKDRRTQSRLILFYKGLQNMANIPLDDLESPKRRLRNMHDQHFKQIYASTDVFKNSFVPRTIKDWNSLDQSVLTSADNSSNKIAKFTELVRKF